MPNNEGMSEISAQRVIDTPIGMVAIAASDLGLVKVDILVGVNKPEFSHSTKAQSHADQAAHQLNEYFKGERKNFELSFDLDGTAFQKAIWESISRIGFGQKVSYGELAQAAGKPLAARAVGGAVGANPLPIVIGCHRVLGSSGKITGYSGGEGVKTKRWLLAHEQIGYADD